MLVWRCYYAFLLGALLSGFSDAQFGVYRCVIPDMNYTIQNLYVGIYSTSANFNISISINSSDTNTAGETYSLECSVTVTGSTGRPTITWLDKGGEITSDAIRMVSATSINLVDDSGYYWTSTLTFSPLAASYAGMFTCRAVKLDLMQNDSINVRVKVPTPMVNITTDPVSPIQPVGSNVTLTCTVELSPAVDVQMIVNTVWTGPAGFITSKIAHPVMGSTNTYTSTALVSSFGRDQSGVYNCIADISSTSLFIISSDSHSTTANITVVSISVVISPSGSPMAGETFSLECSLNGTSDNAAFQWLNGPSDNRTQLTSDGFRTMNSTSSDSQLQFSPLRASHSGLYICQVMVGGVAVEGDTIVEVILPAPTAVTVIPPVGTIIAGSSPNLTCTVELSAAVDVPVTVDTVWSGPALTTVTTTNLIMERLTRYIILGMVDEARNGSYICQATVTSSSQFTTGGGMMSGSTTITVGPLPSPTNILVSHRSPATSISLTWDQPQAADAVNSYMIIYTYEINECRIENSVPFPPITLILNNGYLRSYTIMNSSTSPVEEDSNYTISVTAVNSVTESNPSNAAFTTTAQAVPGVVQSLNFSSVNVTNITIKWDRVHCLERNGPTDGYRVTYYPTPDPSASSSRALAGTGENDRMFTLTGLPPRTNYSFEVQAINLNINDRGAIATFIVSTTAPQNFGFLLDDQLYPNNSVVILTDIGNVYSSLYCLTPSTKCCSPTETSDEATVTREWYLPDGRLLSTAGTAFGREQVSSAVRLYRNSGTSPTGVFRCDVPGASGTSQSMYIGIYPLTDGSLSITSVLFDRDNTTLTCISTGGPPTTITWKKNNVPLNNSLYQQSQRVVNTETATYENYLFSDDVSKFVGTFTCDVSNTRSTAEVTVELNGVFIITDQFEFTVGGSATASCRSDNPATRIEWLTYGMVVDCATSTQQLDLVFSLVNDSIHNQDYICRVTREGGMTATQNFTVKVDVPPEAVIANVSRLGISRAGMLYSLTCTVLKTVGLIYSPTATWTIGGMAISSGNDITVSYTTHDIFSISTLTFDPLRTSHEDIYICFGNLTSPALNSSLTSSAIEDNTVQISTPDVNITVPPGPLYAGRTTPVTLTCTISLNPATDTPISVTNMDITWLNGSTPLSNSDDRVAISPLSGSQQPFTSNLTLSPLSTFDNTSFTCRVRARPPANVQTLVTASEQGERTVLVKVVPLLSPTVSIIHSRSPFMAGQSLTLTCLATVQEGINVRPTLMWTRDGVELSRNSLILTFVPLLTSDGGVYTCTARLNITKAGVDVSGANTTTVSVQIPSPSVIISGSPRNTSFFQGLELTFTCSITLDRVVDTSVMVQRTWNRNGTELVDGTDDGRISVSNPPIVMPPYLSTVSFSPLNISDTGTYECSVTVSPQNAAFITGTTSSKARSIHTVAGFPTPEVDVTDEGTATAGFSGYTLICNTSREPDLPSTTTLVVEWLNPSGNVIVNGTNFTVFRSGPTNDNVLTSRLTFNSLYTFQSGEYICRTLQTIASTVTNHPESVSFTVTVKLPAPLLLMFHQSRNTTLYAGTNFSLTCLITPNTTGVDTDFTVESFVTGPRTSDFDRVSISQQILVGGRVYETVMTFRHIVEGDSGSYYCSTTVTSSQPNVITSDSTTSAKSIVIEPLQPPNVFVSPSLLILAGEPHTLTCTATFVEFLQTIYSLADLEALWKY